MVSLYNGGGGREEAKETGEEMECIVAGRGYGSSEGGKCTQFANYKKNTGKECTRSNA